MAKVIWQRQSLDQLDQLIDYIMQFDPTAAVRTGERLVALGESLASFPHRGRPGPHGRREMTGVPPYILTYEATDETVFILSIRHGARRPLED